MPIEGKFGVWKTDTIASGTSTSEIDLGNTFAKVLVMVPTIASGTITVHVSNVSSGTFYPIYQLAFDDSGNVIADWALETTAATTSKAVVFDIGGAQFIKVVFGASQTTKTVTVRGIK